MERGCSGVLNKGREVCDKSWAVTESLRSVLFALPTVVPQQAGGSAYEVVRKLRAARVSGAASAIDVPPAGRVDAEGGSLPP